MRIWRNWQTRWFQVPVWVFLRTLTFFISVITQKRQISLEICRFSMIKHYKNILSKYISDWVLSILYLVLLKKSILISIKFGNRLDEIFVLSYNIVIILWKNFSVLVRDDLYSLGLCGFFRKKQEKPLLFSTLSLIIYYYKSAYLDWQNASVQKGACPWSV